MTTWTGIARSESAKRPLGAERLHEGAVLEVRQRSRRQTAGKVDAAGRQDLERNTARLRAPDIDHDTPGLRRERIVGGAIQGGFEDGRRAIRRSRQQGCKGWDLHRRIERT